MEGRGEGRYLVPSLPHTVRPFPGSCAVTWDSQGSLTFTPSPGPLPSVPGDTRDLFNFQVYFEWTR